MPVFFPNKESFTIGLGFEYKTGLLLKGDSIRPDILIFKLDFEIMLLVYRITNVEKAIDDEHHAMELVKFIKQYLLLLIFDRLKILKDIKH